MKVDQGQVCMISLNRLDLIMHEIESLSRVNPVELSYILLSNRVKP